MMKVNELLFLCLHLVHGLVERQQLLCHFLLLSTHGLVVENRTCTTEITGSILSRSNVSNPYMHGPTKLLPTPAGLIIRTSLPDIGYGITFKGSRITGFVKVTNNITLNSHGLEHYC